MASSLDVDRYPPFTVYPGKWGQRLVYSILEEYYGEVVRRVLLRTCGDSEIRGYCDVCRGTALSSR